MDSAFAFTFKVKGNTFLNFYRKGKLLGKDGVVQCGLSLHTGIFTHIIGQGWKIAPNICSVTQSININPLKYFFIYPYFS